MRPFRARVEACFNCQRAGHRTDVCPQERNARCKRCGDESHVTPECGTKPTCEARCIVCKRGHPTGGRNCKFKYYSQMQPKSNIATNGGRATTSQPKERNRPPEDHAGTASQLSTHSTRRAEQPPFTGRPEQAKGHYPGKSRCKEPLYIHCRPA